jgi:hypothetical protein
MEDHKFISDNLFLASCDFESLYTNMKSLETNNRISEYLMRTDSLKTEHLDLKYFRELLKLIIFKEHIQLRL